MKISIDGYYSISGSLGWFTLVIVHSNSWVVVIWLGNKHDLIGLIWWRLLFRRIGHADLVTTWWSDTSGN